MGNRICSVGVGLSLRFLWEFQENHEEGYFVYRTLELSTKSWTEDVDLGNTIKAVGVGELPVEDK